MIRRLLRSLAIAALLLGPGMQEPAADRITRFASPPVIDGTLRDSIWRIATRYDAFTMLHPSADRPASLATEIRLGFDRTTLYVALRATEDPSQRRADDWLAFCIDPRADAIDCFCFWTNAASERHVSVNDADGSPRMTRDFAWRSAVTRDATGWTATFAIPIAQLPYVSGDTVLMTFKAARGIAALREEDDYPDIRPDRLHLTQLRPIVLRDIAPSTTGERVDDGFLADLRAWHRRKTAAARRVGDATLEQRLRYWHDADVLDWTLFPTRALEASPDPFRFPSGSRADRDSVTVRMERLSYAPGHQVQHLFRFLTSVGTQALIVVHNDTVEYERYFNGFGPDSMMTSFSVAKSIASTLAGVAIAQGRIHDLADPITRYLPELERRDTLFRRITVGDLMHMASGLRYVEDEGPTPHDNDVTYLAPDMRDAALTRTQIVGPPGVRWHYNNYNPLLLGIILERVMGKSVTAQLQDELWTPLGMQYGGSWSLDSRADGFEKMESGVNARAIDFAKFGALLLHRGRWRGRQLVPAAWVDEATQPALDPPSFYGDDPFWSDHYYGMFWWGSRRARGRSDFYAVGNKGEYIYVSPQKNLVIVRTGFRFGIPSETWVRLFRALADSYPTSRDQLP